VLSLAEWGDLTQDDERINERGSITSDLGVQRVAGSGLMAARVLGVTTAGKAAARVVPTSMGTTIAAEP